MALQFRNNTTDEYVRTTDLPATSPITVVMAVRTDRIPTANWYAWSLGLDGSNYIQMGTGANNLNFFVQTAVAGTAVNLTRSGQLVPFVWHFVAYVRNGASGSFYMGPLVSADPLRVSTSAALPAGDFTPTSMQLGGSVITANLEWHGQIAFCRIYAAELTRAQVERERQACHWALGATSGAHAIYPLIAPSTAIRDWSGNGYDWTTGTAVSAPHPSAMKRRRAWVGKAAGAGMLKRHPGMHGGRPTMQGGCVA